MSGSSWGGLGQRRSQARTSASHLAWAVPAGLAVGVFAFAVSFFAWCGPSRCAELDPDRYAVETAVALVATIAGGVGGGAITVFAPWAVGRGRRLAVGAAVAAVPVAAALWYVPHFTV